MLTNAETTKLVAQVPSAKFPGTATITENRDEDPRFPLWEHGLQMFRTTSLFSRGCLS